MMLLLLFLWQPPQSGAATWSVTPEALTLQGLPSSDVQQLPIKALQKHLRVYFDCTSTKIPADGVPMMGTVTFDEAGKALVFRPRFPFLRGYPHLAVFSLGDKNVPFTFTLAAESHVPALVRTLEPHRKVLPANQLRLYVTFSQAMRRKDAMNYISLQQKNGSPVPQPFVEIPEGLWDKAGKRLTLIFHPGRIKRGVGPNQVMGPVLEAGKSYVLRIDQTMPDALGRPLADAFEHPFRVKAADRQKPNTQAWQITTPGAQSRDILTVTFDEPLDRALSLRLLQVLDEEGPIQGAIQQGASGTTWQFTPTSAWKIGAHRLRINVLLEDLAGNNLRDTFETEIRTEAADRGGEDYVYLPIEIRHSPSDSAPKIKR